MVRYQVKINNKIEEFDRFKDSLNKARDVILNHMEEESQCYWNYLPFSAGVYISSLYDDLSITDEEIVIFEKIQLIMNHLFEENEDIITFLKNDVIYTSADGNVSFIAFVDNTEMKLMIKADEDILITDMFNMSKNKRYSFISRQKVSTKSQNEKRNLGEIVALKVILECLDVQ